MSPAEPYAPQSDTAILDRSSERDHDLWHVSLLPDLHRTLCGLVLRTIEDVGLGEESGCRCHVCDDLCAAWIDGRWKP